MGNSNRRETTKKEDEEEDDLVKVGEEEPGESGGKDDSKDCSGRVEVKGRGLLDESLINIFFYENYFKNFFNLHEINKYVFTANSTKGGYEIEGGGEDKEDTSEETSKIRNNKKIEEMTLYNNRYIVNFLDDTIKSKIEIANFISFYFFFQSVKNKGVTDSVRRKDLSDINYIYRKVRKSKRYIASNQMHTCIRNYLYHIDRRKFPIWNDSVGCERSSGKDVLKNVGVGEIAEEVRRRSDMGDSDTLKEMEPQRSLKGILREVKKGQSGKTKGEGCPSKWKKNVPHRVKIEEDKVTFRRKSTLGRKYEEAFSLYNTGKNYRRARRGGMGDVEGKRKDREEPGEKEKLEEEPEDDAHLRGHVDGIQLSKDGHVSGNGLDTPLKSEMGKRKSDNSSYAVYIKKTLSKVFNRYEINRYGLVRKKKKKGNVFLGHLLKEQMNMGISFSPAGLLIPYHLGVSSLLIEKNILNIHTSIAGSSAGSICACCLGIGLSVDKCFFLIENIISNVYKNGCYQKLQNMLNVELNKYLYAGSYNFLNRRNGSVFVGVTQILPYYKRLNITRFYDDSDLINAVIASCNIPMYLSNNIFVNFRNKKCIDGLFSTKKKDFGCPNTKTDRIVKVSPFDSDYVGIENKNNSVISPHMVKYRHLIFLFLCVKNLFHRVVDNVWVEKDYAFLIQRLKRIMDLRIFSWGEFLRDYFCTPGGGGALITVSMDRGTDVGDSGGLEIPCEAGSSELIHRLEVKLNRFRCTRGNASAKEIFLRVNREALAQFDRHNCKYTNFYNFSVTLINVMSAYFEENFFPSRRLKGVVLGVLRADGEGTAGEANGEANGATNGEKNREKNREKNGEDAELESIYLLLEKEKLLRMEEYIRFHPKLESEVILFFFKEHFANESILRLEKRFLKRSIHELVDALKDICFVDCVERCVRRLVCFSRNAEKDDGKSVLSGSRGEPLAGEFQPRVRAITHYLKHIQIYKNFIYILNEIKAANGRVVKVSEHNYYTFMCLNGEDINDSYLFLYLYLYANLCHRVLFARTEGGKDGVGRGNNCLCGLSGSKARGRMSPPTEGNNCGEGTPGGYIPRGDNHLEEHMMQKKDSVANLSDESRAVSLTKRFTELWSVRRRSGEIETLDEEKEKYKMQNSTENCHASHVDLFMRKREELEVGGEPQLNCSDKNKFEKGLPEVLKNLLLFNHDCGFINRVDEFVKTNENKITMMNEQRRSEICSHLYEIDELYKEMLFLQRFVFSINFSDQTKYKFLRKGSNGKVEGSKCGGCTKEELVGQMSARKERVRMTGCHRTGREGVERTICTSIEEMFVYGSMERKISNVEMVTTEMIDNKLTEDMQKVSLKSEDDWTRRRRGSDIFPEGRSPQQMRNEVSMHDDSPDNFVDDVETSIDKKLYDNDRTYFVKNVFSMRKLLKMAFEGADDKVIRKIYDLGRSDTYLWLYIEYLNVCIFCFRKVYLLYVKLVSVFASLLGITNLSKRRRRMRNDGGSAMLSSVDKFILYVNGRAFNMFELCNFVYVCLGGGVGSLGSVAGGEGSSQMNLVQAVGDVGDVGEELTRDAFRRKWSSGYTVHVDRGGEGKKLKAKREPTEEQEDEDSASGTTLAKRERQQIPEGTLAHHHLEDAQGVDGKVCHEHQSSRKCKRGSEYLKGKGKGKGKEKEERSGNCQIRNPSGDEKENQAHRSRNTGRVMRGFHPNRVSKTKQKKGNQRDGKERKPRSISLPIDLHKTVLKMRHLRGKIKLNENIIDGINREILIGTPYEHIYTHSNFWIYSSSDESDGRNPCDNGFYLNSGDATDSCFDSVFDDLLDEADGFSKISSFFRTFRNMDGNLGLSGYFGF
ncbi:conserved Plasmodium protein, unknown function [Plasmodium knowlesi strain H]|uniref:PNPLA domain-containing protein n=3 Tax=Plasmodium knowlesi TaxID=5850 RepID=A0A1A7VSK8_PLAKH|nr:patatin-like phospholipase, putative [Plasmodium knowlesi strain H]OTN66632.1 Uncharacterized protein PKNOH_S08506800 [Plasmodium knowlesi]CAA9986663.1 patatin-like phospholipase, putative [Plasmodium knowlesi strain H]SBO23469.1 conserved Plasmodium protein, unknown function [Plasmodium knowlesi strain H]SBO24927.1 conserved Plasmodium protein, unknown function [Plasmodium knowlesi strain H]VVS76137.1 patatin-like phospholipase, putative [Plasmodium knowlesi strain H]